jgi:hypothetical protein
MTILDCPHLILRQNLAPGASTPHPEKRRIS